MAREADTGAQIRGKRAADVVRLEDLAPRRNVTGGAGPVVFGERVAKAEVEDAASAIKRHKRA